MQSVTLRIGIVGTSQICLVVPDVQVDALLDANLKAVTAVKIVSKRGIAERGCFQRVLIRAPVVFDSRCMHLIPRTLHPL